MFPHSLSLPSVGRRLGALILGLASIGQGFSFAQDRGRVVSTNPPPQPPQSGDRSIRTVDRPPARIVGERPAQRGTGSMPSGSRGQVNRGTPSPNAQIRPSSTILVAPRPMERCMVRPTTEAWRRRDIMAEIQAMARRGNIAVRPIGEDLNEFTGVSDFPAGWPAYGFRVPAGESIHIRLRHSNEGWFRLGMVNKWGSLEQGMLQNLIPTGNPEVKYSNPTNQSRSVYVIVDDPGWMSSKANPFSMSVTRSWDPTQKKVDDAPIVTGIWAKKADEASPDSEAKGIPSATPEKS